jgi:hypothetical protein
MEKKKNKSQWTDVWITCVFVPYSSLSLFFPITRLSQSIRYKATRRIRSIGCLVNIGLDDQHTLYLSASYSYTNGAPLRPPPFLPFPRVATHRVCPLQLSSTGATSHELFPTAYQLLRALPFRRVASRPKS